MNLSSQARAASRLFHSWFLRIRTFLPRTKCAAFAIPSGDLGSGIGPIFVVNLDREAERWRDMQRELASILDPTGNPLIERVVRYSAVDGRAADQLSYQSSEINPYYSLGDQLFVEPQPKAMPDVFDLERPIEMSPAEIAVACSHIGVWRIIAESPAPYSLILEDDVWFARGFARSMDLAWREMSRADHAAPTFDILYASYKEVRHGAPKRSISEHVFHPERGLWCLSGYVLSKKGAQTLLRLLPCRGPIDLWINHKFKELDVRALRRSVVNQRIDTTSANSYSILPTLSRIGVLDYNDTALFNQRPSCLPVVAFGASSCGLSSLAMALSMLGYRCCSDFDQIPELELERLLAGSTDRVFNAYVNIGTLVPHVPTLMRQYPLAKFIVMDDPAGTFSHSQGAVLESLQSADVLHLNGETVNSWRALCEHLRLPPPTAPYPIVQEVGQRTLVRAVDIAPSRSVEQLRHDRSPWVVEQRTEWAGLYAKVPEPGRSSGPSIAFEDELNDIQPSRWLLRNDTFPGNLGLFRPANVTLSPGGGLSLRVMQESLGVRALSAAAISSRDRFLYGRFEATMQAAGVSGLVTGFFLHRDSPRQEIDVEIAGNRPTHLMLNVFYNPGAEGSKYDYGYRGAPTAVPLGFDASKSPHRYAIEWSPSEIRWFVDGDLVHRRAVWNPTPIPDLPMTLHANTWPTRSRELAGRLATRALPASTIVKSIAVDAWGDGFGPNAGDDSITAHELA